VTRDLHQRAEELFKAALELAPTERGAFLDRECGEDEALRGEVHALLEADEDTSGFLQPPAQGLGAAGRSKGLQGLMIGRHIGRYQIRGEVAAGGMGVVYDAVQDQPRRRVALKVLRAGLASPSALRRFAHEAEVLARLRHPNIAQVYEAGTHEDAGGAVPYFAMEFVPGAKPITRYAETRNLSTRERLELFLKVCNAVHHGHLRGVVHRDLKPGNVLVDHSGNPKVIDFGVARTTDADLTLATQRTSIGEMVGTLRYMSPEQCGGDSMEVDIRSDVYSLGVVLYELLTGAFPYDVASSSPFELPKVIREQEPRRPSSIRRALRGDLEAIAFKALEKEPGRRYQSVADLERDIRNFLNDEPVEAKRYSTWYVLRKAAARHKVAVTGALAFALLTFGSAVALGILYAHAERHRLLADQARQVAENQQQAAEEARRVADHINAFLIDMLGSADPWEGEGRDVTVAEILEKASERVEAELSAYPEVTASLRHTIGTTYTRLGMDASAEPHLRAAAAMRRELAGADDPETLASLNNLGVVLRHLGRLDEAERVYREVLESRQLVLGETHPDTLDTRNSFGSLMLSQEAPECETFLRETFQLCRSALGESHGQTTSAMNNLGTYLSGVDKLSEAESLLAKIVRLRSASLGEDHPSTSVAMGNLAHVYVKQGKLPEAVALYRRMLESRRKQLGENHPRTFTAMNVLARALKRQGQYAEAEHLYRAALEGRRRILGEEHPSTQTSYHNLGVLLRTVGRLDEAERIHRELLDLSMRTRGEKHHHTIDTMNGLGVTLSHQGKLEEAEQLYRRVLELRRETLGPEHPKTMNALSNVGMLMYKKEHLPEADVMLSEVLEFDRKLLGDANPRTLTRMVTLGSIRCDRGLLDQAESLLTAGYEGHKRILGADHPDTAKAMAHLAFLRVQQERLGEAEELARAALETSCKKLSPDHSQVVYCYRILGRCLIESGRLNEAESVLLDGYEHVAAAPKSTRAEVLMLARLLSELYQALDRSEEAAKYLDLLGAEDQASNQTLTADE
jgi:tetratricopeptide (TPR) repeat protein